MIKPYFTQNMNEADFPNEDVESDLEKLTLPASLLIKGLKTRLKILGLHIGLKKLYFLF